MTWEIRQGDALERLAEMPTGSVQTCITSPPYFGLRNYSADGQIGLEQSPDEYVARLVEVFREVRRVLRADGTLWLNLGDSYNADGRKGRAHMGEGKNNGYSAWVNKTMEGTKQKDLLGIPWMVAFALRADGWYLRSDIVWSKPNPMPESVTDRPTKSHEYLFLLSKQRSYYYDADAIREQAQDWGERNRQGPLYDGSVGPQGGHNGLRQMDCSEAGRNKRSVWHIATQPFPGAHFAVFPPKLIEPCVLAGSAPKACGVCGAPWERVVEKEIRAPDYRPTNKPIRRLAVSDAGQSSNGIREGTLGMVGDTRTVGWEPSCPHNDDTGRSVVLDPFAGAGTTGLVALRHGRSFIGIELNPDYVKMATDRISTAERLGFRPPEKGPEPMPGQTSLLDGEAA